MILVSSENRGCGAEVLKLRCMSESQERLKIPISRPSSLPIKPGHEIQTQNPTSVSKFKNKVIGKKQILQDRYFVWIYG